MKIKHEMNASKRNFEHLGAYPYYFASWKLAEHKLRSSQKWKASGLYIFRFKLVLRCYIFADFILVVGQKRKC